jgi:pimeloyl-ACP methyl ester carboxylesterase
MHAYRESQRLRLLLDEQCGPGPDLVFIHGEIHGMEYWDQRVAEFLKDYRCTISNRRGRAKTQWTDYGFSLVNQTRDLELLIEKLGIQQPVIIGLAFGTTLAANYAIPALALRSSLTI